MKRKTLDFMKKHHMAEPGEQLLLGLSGGMDSVCLFYLLRELGYSLTAVHVHHGIRGAEADRDEAFVKALCESHGVPFYGYRFDVPGISKEKRLSEEEAGRMVRKQAFSEVQKLCGAGKIALAHHGNDRAETFLFHLGRGSGVRGLGSMKPVQGDIIRPLLWASREEIVNYVQKNGYQYVEDATNTDCRYTRNKIRHEILPLFQEINAKGVEHICSAAEKLGAVSEYIDREAQKLMEQSVKGSGDGLEILKAELYRGDSFLYIPVLQKSLEYFRESLANITEEHYLRLAELFEMQTGKEIVLPYGICALRTYDGIRIFWKEEKKAEEPVEIIGEGSYEFGGVTFHVSVEEWDQGKNFPIKTYTKCFDYDKINGNVFLRIREAGDFLEINQSHGKKLLQDYFVNEKVPKNDRDKMLLIADGSHILWVVGKRISEYYKVTEETKKVLKVQVSGGTIDE